MRNAITGLGPRSPRFGNYNAACLAMTKVERKKQTDAGRLPWFIVHWWRNVDGLRVVIGTPIVMSIPIITTPFLAITLPVIPIVLVISR